MMHLEINDQPVDLPATTKGLIRLNKAAATLTNLEVRKGEFSWGLTLPLTRQNSRVFGLKLHPQTLDRFSGSYRFRLRAGGQEWQGTFKLTELNNGYRGQLITDASGWATELGDKKLTELKTLRAIPYDGSQLEAIMGQNCDETDIQFPLVAYGNFFMPPEVVTNEDGEKEEIPASASREIGYPLAVDDMAPSVYYIRVLEAILREAGYYMSGAIFNDPEVRKWVITASGSSGDFWPWGALLPAYRVNDGSEEQFSYFAAGPDNGYTNTAEAVDEANEVFYFMPRTPVVPLVNGQPKPGGTRAMNLEKPEFIAPVAGSYSFRYFVTVSAASQLVQSTSFSYFPGIAPVALALMVFRQGEGYEGADDGLCTGLTGNFTGPRPHMLSVLRLDTPGSYILQTGSFTANVPNVYLEAGDTVRLLVFTRRQRPGADGFPTYTRREFRFTTSVVEFACTAFDGPTLLNPADVLPAGMPQKELLKDFLLRTNTVPLLDQERRTVHFLSRSEFTSVQGEPIDLDDIADPRTAAYSPVLADVGRTLFQPAAVEDDVAAVPGTDVVAFDLPSKGPGSSDKVIAGSFAATETRLFTSGGNSFELPAVMSKEEAETSRSEASQTTSGKTPRILVYDAPDPNGPQIPFSTRFIRPGRGRYVGTGMAWAGIGGAVARYYREFLQQSLRGDICKISCALTPSLYGDLRPGREVYLGGALYRVEAINSFDPSAGMVQTEVELIRIV